MFNLLIPKMWGAASLVTQLVKNPPAMWETQVPSLGREDPLEKEMAPHSSTLAWKIPWTEEPGRLQSMGSLRVGHDWVTSLSILLSCIGEGNGNPLQCSCMEKPRDGGAWWAAVYGLAQSRTRWKWLSSSSSCQDMCHYISPWHNDKYLLLFLILTDELERLRLFYISISYIWSHMKVVWASQVAQW